MTGVMVNVPPIYGEISHGIPMSSLDNSQHQPMNFVSWEAVLAQARAIGSEFRGAVGQNRRLERRRSHSTNQEYMEIRPTMR